MYVITLKKKTVLECVEMPFVKNNKEVLFTDILGEQLSDIVPSF